jgi:tyrosinase
MRFSSSVALTLVAATLSSALPAPQEDATTTSTVSTTTTVIQQSALPTAGSDDTAEANKQMDELALFAQQQANATLEDNASKRGLCNINNPFQA